MPSVLYNKSRCADLRDTLTKTPTSSLRLTLVAIAMAQSLITPIAQAAQINVDNSEDAGVGCTFREAVTSMNNGNVEATGCVGTGVFGTADVIGFTALVPSVNITNGQIEIDTDLTINGDAAGITINGDASSRLLNLDSPGSFIALKQVTLSNGSTATRGGAIYANDVTLNLRNSTISGNSATDGGGIFATSSSFVELTQSEVSGNTASDDGGGLYIKSVTTLVLANSTISNNSAGSNGRGGGIQGKFVIDVSLTNSTVSGNSARYGGGLAVSGALTITDSTISENTAGNSGGGIRKEFGPVRLYNSSVWGNVANTVGGGIYSVSNSFTTISNSTLSGNTAKFSTGGAISQNGGSITITNSTVSDNVAPATKGGVFLRGSADAYIFNSIIANTLGGGKDCVLIDAAVITANANNIIEDGSCMTSALAVDPRLDSLADNGGFTLTHALIEGSQAIDAGDNAVCNAAPINDLDQRAEVRPEGISCDIGAFEGMIEAIDDGSFIVIPLPNNKTVVIPSG